MTNDQKNAYEETILGLKTDFEATGNSIIYLLSDGDLAINDASDNVVLHQNYTYQLILEEFNVKLARASASKFLTDRQTWYSANL